MRWEIILLAITCVVRTIRFGFSIQIFIFIALTAFIFLNRFFGSYGVNWFNFLRNLFFAETLQAKKLIKDLNENDPTQSSLQDELLSVGFIFLCILMAFHPQGLGFLISVLFQVL